ncbi:MAG: c-type cytochrome, partial [Planctomycetota bacterium]|nr:c-type cytochrome [Planctomycetota bacterium]
VSILAEAAVRALPRVEDATSRLAALMQDGALPLGVRREALRTLAARGDGARRVIALAREGKLAAELKTEATTTLSTHPDGGVRDEAARVLPLPHAAGGRPLPPIQELMSRRGDVARGRAVFFKKEQASLMNGSVVSCGSCHRVQGQGAWIGPDLSTIGTKYGKDELLRSILNPSAAIGYNFRAQVVATKDGRVLTGLLLEESPERIVLKTREGKRVSIAASEVEERATSDVSLMPEGLAQNMNDRELVDLLAFLGSLKQPVSIVGQYLSTDPTNDAPAGAAWIAAARRKLVADAEGSVDLSPLGADPKTSMYLSTPISSPVEQEARLVLDTTCEVEAWLDRKPVAFEPTAAGAPRAATVRLPKGASALLIRVRGGSRPSLSTTIVAAKPVGFETAAATASH